MTPHAQTQHMSPANHHQATLPTGPQFSSLQFGASHKDVGIKDPSEEQPKGSRESFLPIWSMFTLAKITPNGRIIVPCCVAKKRSCHFFYFFFTSRIRGNKKKKAYLASCVCVAGRCHLSRRGINADFQLMATAIDRDHKQTAPGQPPSTIMCSGGCEVKRDGHK